MNRNRGEIFKELKRLVEFSDSYFEDCIFNPFQIMISELFIKVVKEINADTERSEKIQISYFEYFRIKLKRIKDRFVYGLYFQPHSKHYPILFLPTEPTHLNQIKPILNNLKRQSVEFLVVTNRLPLHRLLKLEFKSIFLPSEIFERQTVHKRQIIEQTRLAISSFRGSNEFLPLDFIYESICTEISNKIELYFQLESLINKFSPKSIFVGNDTTLEGRMMTFLCRKFSGIKSFCIMHGSVTGEPLDTYHQVDCFFLYGKAAMEDLVRNGMSSDRLKISGAPYLDDLKLSKDKVLDSEIKSKVGLTDEKPYILVTNSGPGHSTSSSHYSKILDTIFETAMNFNEVQWVIKLHRKDSLQNFRQVIGKYPSHDIKIISSDDEASSISIYKWIQGATCIITGASTVAIEAMAIDIPVITMDLNGEYSNVDFIDQLATVHVTSLAELNTAVTNLLNNKILYDHIFQNSKKYSQKYFYKGIATSTEIISEELLKTS